MAHRTESLRLADLTPYHVALSAMRLLSEKLTETFKHLDTVVSLKGSVDPSKLASSELGLFIQDITAYAHTGDEPMRNWKHLGKQISAVTLAMFGDARYEIHSCDVDDELGLVLVAASARITLDNRCDVTAKQLAALASCSTANLSHLARTETLERSAHGTYERKSALRWLKERGIEGL